jgi:hypothetical protein
MPPTFAFIDILLSESGALAGHLPKPIETILRGVFGGMI